MRRKPYIFILSICFLYIFLPQESLAGNYIVTPVTSESQLVDGGSYVICYKDTKGKLFNMKGKYFNEETGAIEYDSDNKGVNDDNALVNKSTIFRLEKKDGHWLLWDTVLETHIGENRNSNTRSLMQSYQAPDENCYVTFPTYNNLLDIKIGSKVIRYQKNIQRYELRQKQKEDYYYQVCLYQVEKEPEPFTLRADEDLVPVDQTSDILLDRTFFDGHYNTIILPVTINDYKEVFGEGVTAYEPSVARNDSLTFKPLEERTLTAHRPYLLKGQFGEPPYLLGHSHILYKGDEVTEWQTGNVILKGTYSHEDVSRRQDAFVLNKGKFHPCEQQQHLIVSPFKWYVVKRILSALPAPM